MSTTTPGPQRALTEETPVRSNIRTAILTSGFLLAGGAAFGGWMAAMQSGQNAVSQGVQDLRSDFDDFRREMRSGVEDLRIRMHSVERASTGRVSSTFTPGGGNP